MSFKQFITESNAIARTNALKKQQELIDAGKKNIEITKLPGGVYQLAIEGEKESWFCTPDGRVEELELDTMKLLTDALYASFYARDVLKGPFPAGEPAIATSAHHAYHYAILVLNGPFPAGEKEIATDAECAYMYARDVLKGPFPAGEPAIMRSEYKDEYEELIKLLA